MADGNGEGLHAAVAERLDVRGLICPYPVMETRDALKKLQAGQVLEVLCDYEPAAVTTIPSFCKWKSYPLETVEEGPSLWRLYIQKAD